MSEESPAKRPRIVLAPQPANRTVADRLSHPATVIHPTMGGAETEFEVIIERVYYREDDEGERLCFRGKATTDSWSGYKTFFADECRSIIDRANNVPISDFADWLKSLRPDITPLTLETLIRAVVEYLGREEHVKIGKLGASVSESGTAISFTEIASADADDEKPFDELQIFLDGIKIASSGDPITVDPLFVTIVESVGPPETKTTEIDGMKITSTDTRIPWKDTIEVTPCAGGRVDIRPAKRRR